MRYLMWLFAISLGAFALLPGPARATDIDGIYYLTKNDAPYEGGHHGSLRRDPDRLPAQPFVGCEHWIRFWFEQPGSYKGTRQISSVDVHMWIRHTQTLDNSMRLAFRYGNELDDPILALTETAMSYPDSMVFGFFDGHYYWGLFCARWELDTPLEVTEELLDGDGIDDLNFELFWEAIPYVPMQSALKHSFIILNFEGGAGDADGDGISDGDEINFTHTNPFDPDTDADHSWDGDESSTANDDTQPGTWTPFVDDTHTIWVDDYTSMGEDGTCTRPYHSLEQAIQHLPTDPDGWQIIAKDGTYRGDANHDIDFGGHGITIRSAWGPQGCTVDCAPNGGTGGRGFIMNSQEPAGTTLEGFTIENGDAELTSIGDGGGVYLGPGVSATVQDCVIRNCIAASGGGIYSAASNAAISRCSLVGNTARSGRGGGILQAGGGNLQATNCLFDLNEAQAADGGAIALRGTGSGNATIRNCTITASAAADSGGALYSHLVGTTVKNTILFGNTAAFGHEVALTCGKNTYSTVGASDVDGGLSEVVCRGACLSWDTSNLDADPLFSDGSRRLGDTSPCIGEGSTFGIPAGEIDLDGNPRILNGLVDMGAYEYPGAGSPRPLDPEDAAVLNGSGSGRRGSAALGLDAASALSPDGRGAFWIEPNPLRKGTTLRFETPRSGNAVIGIYDVSGRRIRLLSQGVSSAGRHEVPWDGKDDGGRAVESGVYFARLTVDGTSMVRPIVVCR